jgi:putative transposase
LYNSALEERIKAYKVFGKSPSYFDQCKSLTVVRSEDEEYDALDAWMTRLTSLKRLDLAYQAFFRRASLGEDPGFPRFKSRERFTTLVFGTQGWKLSCGKLRIPSLGLVLRYSGHIHRQGKHLGLRITKAGNGRWYASVLIDIGEAPPKIDATNPVGIDVGLTTFATMSDGSEIANPRFANAAGEKLKGLQQTLSTKKRWSRRRQRAKVDLARASFKVANQRKNFMYNTVAGLLEKYDGFSVEDLDVRGLLAKDGKKAKGLHRSVSDASWATFVNILTYKAEEAGVAVMKVNPRGTSQRCSGCQTIVKKTLRDRVHNCSHCGLKLGRDHNAAINILDLGLRSADSP